MRREGAWCGATPPCEVGAVGGLDMESRAFPFREPARVRAERVECDRYSQVESRARVVGRALVGEQQRLLIAQPHLRTTPRGGCAWRRVAAYLYLALLRDAPRFSHPSQTPDHRPLAPNLPAASRRRSYRAHRSTAAARAAIGTSASRARAHLPRARGADGRTKKSTLRRQVWLECKALACQS